MSEIKTEIEAKFLNVEVDTVRARLEKLGAACVHPMRLMRRVIIEPEFFREQNRTAFIRVRDEGHAITLTYKDIESLSVTGTKEREVTVSDFDETIEILRAGGLEPQSYQESRRETWELGETEVMIDERPWLRPYIEIEAPREELVRDTAAQLGFSWEDAVFGTVHEVLKRQYPSYHGRGYIDIPQIRFDMPVPKEFGESVG